MGNKKPQWNNERSIIDNVVTEVCKDKLMDVNINVEEVAYQLWKTTCRPKTYGESTFQGRKVAGSHRTIWRGNTSSIPDIWKVLVTQENIQITDLNGKCGIQYGNRCISINKMMQKEMKNVLRWR